jgi:hypothetical protein
MYQNFIISYLYEAQHISSDTPPIIRSLKLHWQPLVFHKWKVDGSLAGGSCQALQHQQVCFSRYYGVSLAKHFSAIRTLLYT